MACCFNVACFFCTLCVFIGLAGLVQLCLGIYLSFIETDIISINRLVKTDRFDSYLLYILLVFIGLGFISLVLAFFSIYGVVKRNKSLSLFVAVLWGFAIALNVVMFTVSLLYYYFILPQLSPLLIHSLLQSPVSTTNSLDTLQLKYKCCGINGNDDYKNLPLNPFPASCCQEPNCWHDIDLSNSSNNTVSSIHTDGCYSIIEDYVTIELWVLAGVAGFCALLQILAIIFMCVLNGRYTKVDDNPSFVINHLGAGIPINGNVNKSKNHLQGSSQTIEEIVEITQI